MRFVIGLVAMVFAFAWADERTDKAAIQRVIEALNNHKSRGSQRTSDLFTNDAGADLARFLDLDSRLSPTNAPWPEVTKPVLMIRSTRFITSDVALVDAADTQYGSVIVKREIPLLLAVKKEAGVWRIAALRILDLAILP